MLVRSWNLFHGNTHPPRRSVYLEEMVRLATTDGPDVVALQEVPAWALGRLAGWSGMTAVADVAQPPRLGPVPITAGLGRALTDLNPGLLRSAFSGQGNAILLRPELAAVAHRSVTLNDAPFRREQAERLGLDLVTRLAWAKERRICQAVRLSNGMVVANLHATSSPGDPRIPAAELHRAVEFAEALAAAGDVVVVAGDFNCTAAHWALEGYSEPGPGIDHVTVRGAVPSPVRIWPDGRRLREGMLLSDHAPVELDL
ncbi:MAG TPA: endonuclease/exonuclease/phosphatase family protein [Gaiellaceae bacterium]|nr:endonuclease/exonuclease/phosphatase family protein [Gaiellaceae bacterium]